MELRVCDTWAVEALTPGATVRLDVPPAPLVNVSAERCAALPLFNAAAWGWGKGYRLSGVETQETTVKGALVPGSLELRAAPDGPPLRRGRDYEIDEDWGTVGCLPGGTLAPGAPAWAAYTCGIARLDSVIAAEDGRLALRQGTPHPAAPHPPPLHAGETRLANIWLPARLAGLSADCLFPVLEAHYPEAAPAVPPPAQALLPRAYSKLTHGETLRVLAWGDSVTDAGYLPSPAERWQAQFVARLQAQFPDARIELSTEAWGGRNTTTYLAEPPGAEHNFAEKVLAAHPDLIVSEFVNDSGLTAAQVETQYGHILSKFRRQGAEWIILTPHYMLPEWMGLQRQREIDDDPREYVKAVRAFAAANGVALADAAPRWGRLWRQGLPYMTLMLNAINHPDARGLKLYADSLMTLF